MKNYPAAHLDHEAECPDATPGGRIGSSGRGGEGGDQEDLSLGYSLLRAIAEADHTLVEIAPGVWRHSAEGVVYLRKSETE